MRWRRALILAAVAAAPASAAFAQANNQPANSRRLESPLVKALEACRKIPDAAQRVACYDAASNALVQATNTGPAGVQGVNAVPVFLGVGAPIEKAALLLSVSVQPLDARMAAVVFPGDDVALVSEQFAVP